MFLMAEAAGNVTTKEVKSLVHLFVIITYYYRCLVYGCILSTCTQKVLENFAVNEYMY